MLVTKDAAPSILSRFKGGKYHAIDTETTGLDPHKGDRLFSIILTDDQGSCYLNFADYPDLADSHKLGRETIFPILQDLFNDRETTWFIHNAKFDLSMLRADGLEIKGNIHDTMVGERIVKNNHPRYTLDYIAKYKFGEEKDDKVKAYIAEHDLYEEIGDLKKTKKPLFIKVPLEIMVPYGCQDGDLCYKIGMKQIEEIAALGDRVKGKLNPASVMETEKSLTKVLFEMEHVGIKIDREYCQKGLIREQQKLDETIARFKEITGHDLVDSGKALAVAFGEAGYKYPRTAKGNPCFNSEVLKGMDCELARIVLDYRAAQKNNSTYYANFLELADDNDIIHTNFRQTGTTTGRMCIAKGALVDIVRDVTKYPKGIAIQDVKVGDMAYCYDKNLNLKIKPVVWSGKTGHKKLIRVHWVGQGNKYTGYLDCTPEHRLKLVDGSYKRACDLVPKDRLLALSRSNTCGYQRLHSRNRELVEHRFIYSQIHGEIPENVHHINHSKSDNRVINLSGLSRAEHASLHAKEFGTLPHIRQARSKHMLARVAAGTINYARGSRVANYISVSKFTLLRDLAEGRGRPAKRRKTIADFDTYKRKCAEKNLDVSEVSKRYSSCGYISRGKLLKTLNKPQHDKHRLVRVGYYRYRELLDYYGLDLNHRVTSIEHLDVKEDVYDLEVAEHHNFIVNELCVHNSCAAPNLQNVPKNDPDEVTDEDFPIRRAFVPREDYCFVMIDFSQQEYRLMLDYANETGVIKQILEDGLDVHDATAELMKVTRTHAKTLNFMILYGGGIAKLAKALGIKDFQAKDLKNRYFNAMLKVERLINNVISRTKYRGWLHNWAGRVVYVDKGYEYKAPNYLIQGGCADVIKIGLVDVAKILESHKSRPLLQIHDEILYEVHKDELAIVELLKRTMEDVYPHAHLPMTCTSDYSWKNWHDKIEGLPK